MGCRRGLLRRRPSLCSCFVLIDRSRTPPWLAIQQPSNARRRRCPPRRRRAALRAARRQAAVDLASPVDADVAVDTARRRGRGAQSNASGRYEPVARVDVRRRLAESRGTAGVQDQRDGRRHPQDHHPQRLARHLVRPIDQSVSWLRARLHLLLRAADPRLSRAVAGARFRVQAVREARGGQAARTRTVGAGLRAAHHRDRHQYRSLPADRDASTR